MKFKFIHKALAAAEYDDYFDDKMDDEGIDSPDDLKDSEKDEFFEDVDKGWNSEEEEGKDGAESSLNSVISSLFKKS